MKAEEINVNLDEMSKFKKQNAKERLEYIDYWVNYIKTHSDKKWSKHQNVLIDSQMQKAAFFAKNGFGTEEES